MLNFTKWPPSLCDMQRLRDYERSRQIFEGDYKHAFSEKSAKVEDGQVKEVLGADWGALICKVSSDMLFGEPPIVSAGADQDQLDALVEEAELWPKLLEASTSQAFAGDCVLRLLWDEKRRRVDVREIPACNYFVELDPDDIREVRSQAIAWLRWVSDTELFLRVDHFRDGWLLREAYRFPSSQLYGCNFGQIDLARVPLAHAYPADSVPAEREKLPLPQMVWHIPNQRHGARYWGTGDFAGGVESLLDSYNERLSELHRVLSKHSDPKILLPEGVLDSEGNVNWKELGAIEVPPGERADGFKYLVWDPQLLGAFKELETLSDLIFKFSEIAPAVFGEDKAGSIESGRAMKFRFQRTIAKIARKRGYWDPPLRQLLWAMQVLAALKGQTYGPDDTPVKPPSEKIILAWQDGLPQDVKEQVEIEQLRVNSGLTSKAAAISRIDQIPLSEAEAELARADEEKKAATPPALQGVKDERPPDTAGAGEPTTAQPGAPESADRGL